MKRSFTRKGYGRIFVDKEENIEFVKNMIREIDEYEFDYLPDNFIAPFSEYPTLGYVHKFDDIDINLLTAKCFKEGVYVFCCDNGMNPDFGGVYAE